MRQPNFVRRHEPLQFLEPVLHDDDLRCGADAGGRHRVLFPGVMIILDGAPGTPPPTGPTEGSVVNHVGFIVRG